MLSRRDLSTESLTLCQLLAGAHPVPVPAGSVAVASSQLLLDRQAANPFTLPRLSRLVPTAPWLKADQKQGICSFCAQGQHRGHCTPGG